MSPSPNGATAQTSIQWQLAADAAGRYHDVLVPTILGPAARALLEAMAVRRGDRVLDVGCGTGAATRFAAEQAGDSGSVVGIDVNPAMIACAREHLRGAHGAVTFTQASALELPFEDDTFDVVLCAQTLQFLPDRGTTVAQMRRVLRPGGRVGVSTWSPIEDNPYFESLVEAVRAHVGDETAAGLGAAFKLTDAEELRSLLSGGTASDGLEASNGVEASNGAELSGGAEVRTVRFELDLPDASSFVPRHIAATPMAAGYARASAEARAAVLADVAASTAPYRIAEGMRVPFATLVGIAVV